MKRIAILIGGGLVLLVGIALLVLPGPGFLLIFGGLVILGTEFAWARKYVDFARDKAEQGIEEVAKSPLRTVFAGVFALGMMVLGALPFFGVKIPFVGKFTGGVLIVSGLFLIGTLVYAKRASKPMTQPPTMPTRDDAVARLAGSRTTAVDQNRFGYRLPADYAELAPEIGAQDIESDFVLLTAAQCLDEMSGRDLPLVDFGTDWFLFATAENGDAWALGLHTGNRGVAHLNHDRGPLAVPEPMRLSYPDWLRLAIFVKDLESWRDRSTGESVEIDLPEHVAAQLNALSPGLAQRYPYDLT